MIIICHALLPIQSLVLSLKLILYAFKYLTSYLLDPVELEIRILLNIRTYIYWARALLVKKDLDNRLRK